MSEIVPYLFESREVRVVMDEAGEPWWVAKDVAEALGYVWNGSAAVAHVPEAWRGLRSVLTTSGVHQTVCLSEQGLYFFLGRSDKEKALPFQMWLARDVVPAIRKTGRYEAQNAAPPPTPALPGGPLQDKVSAHFAVLEYMRSIPGVNAGIAGAVVLDAIHVDTGLTMEPYRKLLPVADGPTATLNATRLGEALGVSARKANKALEAAGLQRRSPRGGWELTEAGALHGEMVPFSSNGHAGYQPLWKQSVVGVLKGGA